MNDDRKWQIVLARDPEHGARFFYAVRTTGVYCRPSCPSRRPHKQSVEFFTTTVAAESAGYRACQRCRPDRPDPQLEAVRRACRYIEANLETPLTLKRIAEVAGLSRFHLLRLFQRRLGVTPREYRDAHRLKRFRGELGNGQSVTDAIYAAGFGSSSRLYEKSGQLGMTPVQYRNGGAGQAITFTVFETSVGTVLLAATGKGVCSVRLGDAARLEHDFRGEFPQANIRRDDHALAPYAGAILGHLAGAPLNSNLPLDIQGTAFQTRVWNALREIPRGETRSYADVARQIGEPSAVRAVANACARNPVALAIPCHRVVRTDGEPGGYRWGMSCKRKLLEMESR